MRQQFLIMLAFSFFTLYNGSSGSDSEEKYPDLLYKYCNITVCVTKASLFDFITDKGHVIKKIGMGSNEQQHLRSKIYPSALVIQTNIGYCQLFNKHMCIENNPDSNSDDDEYRPFSLNNKKNTEHIQSIELPSTVSIITVVEPCIKYDGKYLYSSIVEEKSSKKTEERYRGKEALTYAKKDLATAYNQLLAKMFEDASEEISNTFAITSLGTGVGYPRKEVPEVAVSSIIDFFKKNNRIRGWIYLVAKKKSEYNQYKMFFNQIPGIIVKD